MRCGTIRRALCANKRPNSSRHVDQEAQCARPRCAKAPSLRTVWPRRVPALGQRCTRAGERSAGLFVCVTRTTRTCPNIRDLILKCTKTHGSAQLGLRTQIDASSSWRYIGAREGRGPPGENRNQTIKCRTKIKQSNTTCNTTIPYHPEKESKQSKYR